MARPLAAHAVARSTSPLTDEGPTPRATHAGALSAGRTPEARLEPRRNNGPDAAICFTGGAPAASGPSR
eukprot:4216667-Alexandrium_andersonii.AAC.1